MVRLVMFSTRTDAGRSARGLHRGGLFILSLCGMSAEHLKQTPATCDPLVRPNCFFFVCLRAT